MLADLVVANWRIDLARLVKHCFRQMMNVDDCDQRQFLLGTEKRQATLEVGAKSFNKARQQHSLTLSRQVACAVHRNDGFACARRACNLDGTIESSRRQTLLRRMQKGDPR